MHPLIPSDEQRAAIDHMVVAPDRAALLAAETGVGKTLMATEVAKALNAQTILVIGPINRPVVNAWKASFTRQGITLPFQKIDAKTPQNFDLLRMRTPGVYYVGREFMHLSATDLDPNPVIDKKTKEPVLNPDGTRKMTPGRKARWSWSTVHPELVIFDEIQSASNRDSNTYKALKYLHGGFKIAASATPQGNQFEGLWSVCRWLWPKTKTPEGDLYVDNSFWRWAARWAQVEDDYFAGKKVRGEKVPGQFVSSLPCYIRIEADRTPVEQRNVYVDLTPSQRVLYSSMEADSLAWLDDNPLVADIPIVQRIRLRQITLGEVTFNEAEEVDFAVDCASSKIEALQTIIAKYHPTDTVFILTDSAKFAAVVTQRLGPLAREWSGRTKPHEREQILAEFGSPEVRYIVAVIPAVAEGLDMLQHVCSTEVWLNESNNEMLNTQTQGRLNRRGQQASVITQWRILAKDTADDDHFNNLVKQRIESRATLRKET